MLFKFTGPAAVCGLQEQRRGRKKLEREQREEDRESYLMRPNTTTERPGPLSVRHIPKSRPVLTLSFYCLALSSLLSHTLVQCISSSFLAYVLLSPFFLPPPARSAILFHFFSHPTPNLCSCGKLYPTATNSCSNKSGI